jgi:hypothetical protein
MKFRVTFRRVRNELELLQTIVQIGLALWRSGIAPESIGRVYGHDAMGSNPSASPGVKGTKGGGWGTPPFNRLARRRRGYGALSYSN